MNLISGISKAYKILIKKQKLYLFIIFCFLITTMLLEVFSIALVIPISEAFFNQENIMIVKFKDIINNLFTFTANYNFLTILVLFVITFFIIKFILLILINILQSRFIFKIFTEISERLISKYLSLDLLKFNTKSVGELTRNVNSEPAVFINQFSINIIILFKEFLIFLGIISFLLINSAKLTIFIILITLIISLIFILITSNYQVRLGSKRLNNDGKRLNTIIKIINGFKVIKIFQLKNFFLKEFIYYNKTMMNIGVKQNFIKSFPKFYIELVMVIALISMFIFFKKNETQYSEIISSMSLILVSALRLMPVIKNINISYSGVLAGLPSVELIYRDFSQIEEKNLKIKNTNDLNFENKIVLSDISFKYENTEKWIFKNLNLEIKKFKSIGLVGESGSGKTSLINIIMGLINPNDGKVLIDESEMNKHLNSWQNKIGLIPQEAFLTDDTIKNNICLGVKEDKIDEQKLNKIIHDVKLETLIKEKEKGLDQKIGENGKNLSGGQKQKISIARALYFDREILVFDEPTSSLDKENQQEVHKAINNLIGKKTIILISHKKELLENFDKIYNVSDKKLKLLSFKDI